MKSYNNPIKGRKIKNKKIKNNILYIIIYSMFSLFNCSVHQSPNLYKIYKLQLKKIRKK